MLNAGPAVLVLGGTGMLGHACVEQLLVQPGWTVAGTQRRDRCVPFFFDIAGGAGTLAPLLESGGFQYVINCAGMLKADIDERESASISAAIRVNAAFPHDLVSLADHFSARVIHISTDGVFQGGSALPYLETSPADATDVYGKTKWLGECPAPNALNIRCSIVGRDQRSGRGLLEWFLALPEDQVAHGYDDEIWNGVSTVQLAELIRRIIIEDRFEDLRAESPVHHFCPNPAISKYQLLSAFSQASGKRTRVEPQSSPRGPSRRILGTRYLRLRALYEPPRTWPEIVKDLLVSEHSNT